MGLELIEKRREAGKGTGQTEDEAGKFQIARSPQEKGTVPSSGFSPRVSTPRNIQKKAIRPEGARDHVGQMRTIATEKEKGIC